MLRCNYTQAAGIQSQLASYYREQYEEITMTKKLQDNCMFDFSTLDDEKVLSNLNLAIICSRRRTD